nr:MAG TPA: cysteine-rich protein [Caudoviricetes sp.]
MRVSVYCPCCGAAGIKRKLMEVDTAAKGTIYPYCKACKRNIEIHLPLKK